MAGSYLDKKQSKGDPNWHVKLNEICDLLKADVEDARRGKDTLADFLGDAKGTCSSVAARLNVSLEPDGTLKSTAPSSGWWTEEGNTVSYVSSTQFKISGGDFTSIYTRRRAIRATLSGSTQTSYVVSSSYSSANNETTVTLRDAILDNTLSKIEYGQQVANAPSIHGIYGYEAGEDITKGRAVCIKSDGKAYMLRHPWSSDYDIDLPETVAHSYGDNICIDILDSTHVVFAYKRNSDGYGRVAIGTVSGNSISWGDPVTFNAASTEHIRVVALSSTCFVILFSDAGNSNYGTAIVGTVSDTTITLGSETAFKSASTTHIRACKVTTSKVYVQYVSAEGSYFYIRGIVGTVDCSARTISFGSEATLLSSLATNPTRGHDCCLLDESAEKVISAYRNEDNDYGYARVLTISDSSITQGSVSQFGAGLSNENLHVDAEDTSHFLVFYIGSYLKEGTVSDSSISWGSAYSVFDSGSHYGDLICFDANHALVANQNYLRIVTKSNSSFIFSDIVDSIKMYGNAAAFDTDKFIWACTTCQIHYRELVTAYPIGIAFNDTNSGDNCVVYNSGELNIFSSLVPGYKYEFAPNGSLVVANASNSTGIRAGVATASDTLVVML